MTPFDSPYPTSYCFNSSLTMALSHKVLRHLTSMQNDLQTGVSGHSRSSKVTPFYSLHMVSYYRPIVTLSLKCTIFEIWQHRAIDRKSQKLSHSHLTHALVQPLQRTPANIRINLILLQTAMMAIPGQHFCCW